MTSVHATPPVAGTPPVYPFAEWLDGQRWTLNRGRDFWGPPRDFARRIQASARARRLVLFMRYEPDGQYIELCATPRPSAESAVPVVKIEDADA